MSDLANLINSAEKLVRVLGAFARGNSRQNLGDVGTINPDNHGFGFLLGLHTSIAASNGGADVVFNTNPDMDLGIFGLRGAVEVGTGENTANNGMASFSAAHCAFSLQDRNRNHDITRGQSPAAGNATSAYIDMMLLGANGGPWCDLPVPYVARAQNGSSTITGSFATDSVWPGTRRAGVILKCVYRRRNFRGEPIV